jgi:plasmid stabilization system protein ParE
VPDTLLLLPSAEADVIDQSLYLAEHSREAAERFVIELRAAFDRLLRFPYLGRLWPTHHPELRGLRRMTMTGFPVSIFYRPGAQAIEIVRILHHSRDLPPEFKDT